MKSILILMLSFLPAVNYSLSAGKRFADPEVTIQFVNNGIESSSPSLGSFIIQLSSAQPEDITVHYTVSGTATNGLDYTIPVSVMIGAGGLNAQLPVDVLDDMILEPNETVIVTLTSAETASAVAVPVVGSATLSITDDDNTLANRQVYFSAQDNGEEGGAPGSVTLSLRNGYTASENITITYTIAGTATSGTDYTPFGFTAVIKKDEPSVTVPINIIDDDQIEGDEFIELAVAQASGSTGLITYGFGLLSGTTVTILDNDNRITVTKLSDGEEGVSNTGFYLSLPPGIIATENISINYALEGVAVNGADYATLNGTILLKSGDNRVLIPVTVTDDEVIETTEDVILKLDADAAQGVPSGMDFTIIIADNIANIIDNDNTAANRVISISTVNGKEPNTNGSITFSLPGNYTCSELIRINYTVTGTAGPNIDYVKLTGAVQILAGNHSSSPVPVTIKDDLIIEGDETVTVTITSATAVPSGAIFTAAGPGTVIIGDDDNTDMGINVTATDANAAEPADNGNFRITLPTGKTASVPVTIHYTITGTARDGTDYTSIPLSALIAAGDTYYDVPVNVIDDNLIEGDETVILTITSIDPVAFGFIPGTTNTATVTIRDDDNTDLNIVVTASDPNAAEPADAGEFTLSVAPGKLAGMPISVSYTLSGTAEGGKDFTTPVLTSIIDVNNNGVPISIPVLDDDLIEGTETVILTITNVSAVISTPFIFDPAKTATVNIRDNDDTDLDIVATATDASAKEPSDNGAFTLSLAPGKKAAVPVLITYTLTGTATNGTDYSTVVLTATIPQGENSVPVSIPVLDDNLVEGDETVILTITAVDAPYTFNSSATVIIGDDDNTTVNIGDQDGNAANGINGINAAEPATNGNFNLSIAPGKITTLPIVITYTISGTASNGTDYTSLPMTATIEANKSDVDILVKVMDDDLIEGDETLILTITGIQTTLPVTIGTQNSASIIIDDDDDTDMNVGIGDDDGDASNGINGVNAAEPSTNGGFTVSVAPGKRTAVPITLSYTVTGTAKNGIDYTNVSGTVTIEAGKNGADIPVTVIDDNLIEGDETLTVTINGIVATLPFVVGPQNNAGIIIDDDDDTDMSVGPVDNDGDASNGLNGVNVSEPNTNGAFTISVAPGKRTSVPITITYTLSGTATDGTDYETPPAQVTIAAETGSIDIPLNVIDDELIEGEETVLLNITALNTSMAFIPVTTTASVNVEDDDIPKVDLVVTKTVVQPGPYTVGQDITYKITVSNTGNIPATEVVVKDSLPAVIDQPPVATVLKGIVTQSGNIITWEIDQLEIGETLEMLLVCRASDGGTLTNTASGVAKETEGKPTDNTAASTIKVDGDALIIPNVFTPNGDGKNEKFDIGGLDKYPSSTLYVYNRWGAMVYQSKNYQNNWTGTGLNAGSYFYTLEVKKADGTRIYKGWVEILR